MTIVKGEVLTMAEYIDRKALGISKCNPDVFENKGYAEGWNSAIEIIENAPDADVAEVKHGYWEEVDSTPKGQMFHCSVCHKTAYFPQPTRDKTWKKQCPYTYRPNCGAKMDERVVQDDDT